MKLFSTRNLNIEAMPKTAILKGLSDDGGLFCPKIEDITSSAFNIESMLGLSYKDIAKKVFKIFLSDFSEEELKIAIDGAYSKKNFGSYSDVVTPITKIGENFILELYHGPTSAFKDVALTILPRFLSIASKSNFDEQNKIYILTATSGDTGKAALSGFKDVPDTFITVFYPTDGVSNIQKLQMQTSEGNNVSVIAVNGNFDDCQRLVKEIYTDKDIAKIALESKVLLSSANSINIGRLVPQIVYYIYSYARLVKDDHIKFGDKINFVVPTGNFGDILAGFLAKLLGTPIDKLIIASNSNNVLTDFVNTGVYNKNREFYKTISPSMDILVSSNLERLLFLLSGNDADYVKSLMDDLNKKGMYKIDDGLLSKIRETFVAYYADENECKRAIKEAFTKDSRLIDTHTAIAYACLNKYSIDHSHITYAFKPSVILSTASPYKFVKSVLPCVTDVNIDKIDDFECMERLHELSNEPIPEGLSALKDKKIRFDTTLDYNKCKSFVIDNINKGNL